MLRRTPAPARTLRAMLDHFARLDQPRRPWLEEAALKEAFHRATAQEHPDRAGGSGEMASTLNAAYAVLRDPAARLKHLLELDWPDASLMPAGIAPDLAEMFGQIAALRQQGAALKKREAAAQSPIGRALLAEEHAVHRRKIECGLAVLASAEAAALGELRGLDAAWEQRDETTRGRLAAAQQRFAFLAKWQLQLREDLFQLGG